MDASTAQGVPVDESAEPRDGEIPRGIDLADVERAIVGDENLEDWHREQLLSEARSLAHFYRSH
jgi:hypothetical protein